MYLINEQMSIYPEWILKKNYKGANIKVSFENKVFPVATLKPYFQKR